MTSRMMQIPSAERHEKIYQDLKEVLDRYPETSTIEMLAILSRVTGFCVGLQSPGRREEAREVVIVNLDMGEKETAGEDA